MRRHLARSVVLLVATIAGVLHWQTRRLEAENTSFTPLRVPPRYRPAVARIPAFVRDGVPLDVPLALPLRLRAGETLGEVLVDQGLEPAAAELAIRAAAEHVDLRKLKPGERYTPAFDRSGALVGFSLRVEGRGALELDARGERLEQRVASVRREPDRARHRRNARKLARSRDARRRRAGGGRLQDGRRPAVGRRLQQGSPARRHLRRGLRRGPPRPALPRRRQPAGGGARERRPPARGLPFRRRLVRRRRPAAREAVPALAAAVHADHVELQPPPVPPGPQVVPAALRRRLRRAGGDAGARDRVGRGGARRAGRAAAAER